ncbi:MULTISPECIES: MBL fold metallo-hydrolase [unclassified Mitsuokella]|uniref:MBL fold metallo-hydrolase n=1 Tax=unclassified Mitsuokella TaxID=2637239 RepID=UPI000E505385|nr:MULTISPECIES: MBL fold metallo-hydrolase [unclassified Mitsuokella]RGS70143.1 MBL fold metallo-hydrolase [Mitsuokella sp. AF21-1AC]RHM53042.1 MBL fold metallo-hydrolase [Mitsuokella sp. AF33-22]
MQVVVLASGSKGNAVYVEMDGTKLLIDAGISATRIKKRLAEEQVDVSTLDGILVTHEHRDHIAGLATLSKWYRLPIFTRRGTIEHMSCRQAIPDDCFHPIDGAFRLGDLTIDPFRIPHDAADPVGYRVMGSQNCTLATDLGFVTSSVQAAIDGADVLVLEANHDPEVLKHGDYPWALKRRILSNRGHLANADAAWALVRMKKRPEHVFLAHLSEKNNTPELASETVASILKQQGVSLELSLTAQDEPVRLH